ncbi:MAG: MerR family transcriptional regulator [Caldilineales bacterium]|nr:MerR family transcriptional regulator [Caldilineales bacterium]
MSTIHTMDDSPAYNLKAVVRETGLKPDTLRAWERRYGLPQPQRSSGRHRLYSQRDIDTLKWLVERQEEGMTISRAVDLWQKLESEGQDPLLSFVTTPQTILPVMQGAALDELRAAWLEACVNFDEARAEMILSQAFALFPPDIVALDLIRVALVQVGEGWHAGMYSVQQEHFTSELAVRRLEALIAVASPPTRKSRIMIGCAPNEAHTISAILLTYLLRRQGWHTIYLGANVPEINLETSIRQARPDLVILAAQLLSTAASLKAMSLKLQEMNVPLAFGGIIFTQAPGLRQHIAGHYLGDSLEEAPAVVERIVHSATIVPDPTPPPVGYAQALSHFQENRALIAARVWQMIKSNGGALTAANLNIANTHLGNDIEAALQLGDIEFLNNNISWIKGLTQEREMPPGIIQSYLKVYHQAADEYLDPRGRPILDWLQKASQS